MQWKTSKAQNFGPAGSSPVNSTNFMNKLQVGKEYWVQQKFAVLEFISGNTAVLRDRWDNQFECDISYIQEKTTPCASLIGEKPSVATNLC